MNLLSENSCNRQNSVYLGYPQHCEQTAYGINHTKFCCVCKHLWSLSFSKLPHSLRLCGILKKPLDHKCLHTSIVQYYLTSQLWCLNNSQEPCEWVNADLRVLCIESEQIMHLKVGCPNFGPVRGSAIYPTYTKPIEADITVEHYQLFNFSLAEIRPFWYPNYLTVTFCKEVERQMLLYFEGELESDNKFNSNHS